MSESKEGGNFAAWSASGPVDPEKRPNFVWGEDPQKLNELGRALADVQASMKEGRIAASWPGGGTPKAMFADLWTEQTTRVLEGKMPTVPPYEGFFEKVAGEHVAATVMVPKQEYSLLPSHP